MTLKSDFSTFTMESFIEVWTQTTHTKIGKTFNPQNDDYFQKKRKKNAEELNSFD